MTTRGHKTPAQRLKLKLALDTGRPGEKALNTLHPNLPGCRDRNRHAGDLVPVVDGGQLDSRQGPSETVAQPRAWYSIMR